MNGNMKNNDALRELFSGLKSDVLTQGAKADIIARIFEAEAKFKGRKDNRLEWILFAVFGLLMAGIIIALRYFLVGNREVSMARNSDLISNADAIVEEVSAHSADLVRSIGMPKFTMPDISLDIPPALIFIAVSGLVLLVVDQFMRRHYNKKHSTEV